jgi:SAM-dependent methyltransferase
MEDSELKSWVNRFSGRAEDYSKYRPTYPSELIDTIISGAGARSELCVVDVGAGTGISASSFADRGMRVIAIEPNDEMLEMGRALFPRIDFRPGTAEYTGLLSSSASIVACFQAFHWTQHQRALKEFFRILSPQGRVALAWNIRDDTDEFTCEYGELVDAYVDADLKGMLNRKEESGNCLLRSSLFIKGVKTSYPFSQRMDETSLLGRIKSVSSVPTQGLALTQLLARMRRLYARFASDGMVTMKYKTILFLAEALK